MQSKNANNHRPATRLETSCSEIVPPLHMAGFSPENQDVGKVTVCLQTDPRLPNDFFGNDLICFGDEDSETATKQPVSANSVGGGVLSSLTMHNFLDPSSEIIVEQSPSSIAPDMAGDCVLTTPPPKDDAPTSAATCQSIVRPVHAHSTFDQDGTGSVLSAPHQVDSCAELASPYQVDRASTAEGGVLSPLTVPTCACTFDARTGLSNSSALDLPPVLNLDLDGSGHSDSTQPDQVGQLVQIRSLDIPLPNHDTCQATVVRDTTQATTLTDDASDNEDGDLFFPHGFTPTKEDIVTLRELMKEGFSSVPPELQKEFIKSVDLAEDGEIVDFFWEKFKEPLKDDGDTNYDTYKNLRRSPRIKKKPARLSDMARGSGLKKGFFK